MAWGFDNAHFLLASLQEMRKCVAKWPSGNFHRNSFAVGANHNGHHFFRFQMWPHGVDVLYVTTLSTYVVKFL